MPPGKMTVSLTPELERFVEDEVRKGAYASKSEFIQDVLKERLDAARGRNEKLHTLDEALRAAIQDMRDGRIQSLEAAFSTIRAAIKTS